MLFPLQASSYHIRLFCFLTPVASQALIVFPEITTQLISQTASDWHNLVTKTSIPMWSKEFKNVRRRDKNIADNPLVLTKISLQTHVKFISFVGDTKIYTSVEFCLEKLRNIGYRIFYFYVYLECSMWVMKYGKNSNKYLDQTSFRPGNTFHVCTCHLDTT